MGAAPVAGPGGAHQVGAVRAGSSGGYGFTAVADVDRLSRLLTLATARLRGPAQSGNGALAKSDWTRRCGTTRNPAMVTAKCSNRIVRHRPQKPMLSRLACADDLYRPSATSLQPEGQGFEPPLTPLVFKRRGATRGTLDRAGRPGVLIGVSLRWPSGDT